MVVLFLSGEDVDALDLPIVEAAKVIETAFRLGSGESPVPGAPLKTMKGCSIDYAAARVGGGPATEAAGIRWTSFYPQNIAKGLPVSAGLLVLSDPATGVPLAVLDSPKVSALRAAATVAVAAKALARPGAKCAAVIGALKAQQSQFVVEALLAALPTLTGVALYDSSSAEGARACAVQYRSKHSGIAFDVRQSAVGAVDGADVIVSCVPRCDRPSPAIRTEHLSRGATCISLDLDCGFAPCVLKSASAKFFCDDVAQLIALEAHGRFKGLPPAEGISSLGDAVTGRKKRESSDERVCAAVVGSALCDVAIARAMYDRARIMGIGGSWNLYPKF